MMLPMIMGSSSRKRIAPGTIADYLRTLVEKGHHAFYTELGGDTGFVKFTATFEKPRSINNLAGGHPMDYRLTLETSHQPSWFDGSRALAPAGKFEEWLKEVEKRIEKFGVEIGSFDTNSGLTRIMLNLKTSDPETIASLDALAASQKQTQITR